MVKVSIGVMVRVKVSVGIIVRVRVSVGIMVRVMKLKQLTIMITSTFIGLTVERRKRGRKRKEKEGKGRKQKRERSPRRIHYTQPRPCPQMLTSVQR